MGRKFFIGYSWTSETKTEDLITTVDAIIAAKVPTDVLEVVVSPPFTSLILAKGLSYGDFELAAQSCWAGGEYTNEVSADMLAHQKIPWVIVGRSDRSNPNVSDESVGEKVSYALSKELKVIAVVGETLEERNANSTRQVIADQLRAIAEKVSNWENVVIAYEPMWAVKTAVTPEQAQEVHHNLRKWLKEKVSAEVAKSTRIVCGGLINSENYKGLAVEPDVDGFLIEGDSLEPQFTEFIKIIKSVKSELRIGGS